MGIVTERDILNIMARRLEQSAQEVTPEDTSKPSLLAFPTFPTSRIDGVFVQDAYAFLECRLERIIDGFGTNSLIVGRIIAAHVHEDVLRTSIRT